MKWNLQPVTIDGLLVYSVAFCGAVLASFSSDSVYHYVNATAVFWIKTLASACFAGSTALIGFRSKVYARYSDTQSNQPPLTTTK